MADPENQDEFDQTVRLDTTTTGENNTGEFDRTIRLETHTSDRVYTATSIPTGSAEKFGKTQPLSFSQTRIFSLKRRRNVSAVMEELRDKRPKCEVVFSDNEDTLEPLDETYNRGTKFAEGGQGLLCRGFDRKLQRLVAIKSLREELNGNEAQRGRFLTEARITAQLDHPAVVPIYTLNSDEGNGLHLAMKLINGETFKTYLDQVSTHYRLDGIGAYDENKALRDRLDIFLKVCDALEYAHSRNVMHCDLKPSNIMIGEYRETYIMDWGIACKIDDPEHKKDDEPPKQICGTPQYLAPEVIRGEYGDQRADIFAMGVILFETVTLKSAFNGKDMQELLTNIRHGRMESIEHYFGASIDADLRAVIRKATANKPDERYQQIRELSADLRRYLTGLEVSAKPDRLPMKVVRWFYLHRRLTLIVMLCGLLLGAGALSFAFYREYRASIEQRQRDHALGLAFSLCSMAGYQLDEQFGKLEMMADILASDVQFLLQYDLHSDYKTVNQVQTFHSVPELKKSGTPTLAYSQFHCGQIDLESVAYNTTPDTDKKLLKQRLSTITRFIPRLLQTILESPVKAHVSEKNLAEAKLNAFRDGTPMIRVIFGFPDGLFAAYPASPDFPAIYDPRTRPWYQAVKRNPAASAVWSPPYIDSIPDFGLVLSCSVPLNLLGTQEDGVCTVDISLSELVEELQSAGSDGPYVLEKVIVDGSGQIIISTNRSFANARLRSNRNAAGEVEFTQLGDPSLLKLMKEQRVGVVTRNVTGREIIYAFCHIRSVDWYYLEKLDMKLLLQNRPFTPQTASQSTRTLSPAQP